MDATGTDRAVRRLALQRRRTVSAACRWPPGTRRRRWCSSRRPCRCPRLCRALRPSRSSPTAHEAYSGWQKWNSHYWLENYEDFLEFFFSQVFTEPHSTKQREDAIGWALETDPETLVATQLAPRFPDEASVRELTGPRPLPDPRDPRTRRRRPPARLRRRARRADRRRARDPRGLGSQPPGSRPREGQPAAARFRRAHAAGRQGMGSSHRTGWSRGRSRRKRALYISSPIGLGHAQRDVAIAEELRKLHPDLEIDWLAQNPVTQGARGRGRADPSGQRASRQRVAPHRVGVGRARPALLPGLAADGRDPGRQLHGLPRPRRGGAVRPLDRRRGVGARLLPAREPGAEARGIRAG